MIRRRVFEKLDPPYFKYVYDEMGKLKLGQDFYFCQKAREAGFRIYVHTGILTSHYQNIDLLKLFKRRFGLQAKGAPPANANIRRIK
jgi:GT2 family glycosyltransferase